MQQQINQAIERIQSMEALFDRLLAADREDPGYEGSLAQLAQYYESGLWLEDYERDERGELPAGLKRGVLSQDTLYNLLEDLAQQR